MFDDEDYSFLTGGLGDLDGDGKVDLVECILEEDDFQRIMQKDNDDFLDSDDEDIDFEDSDFGDDDFENEDFDDDFSSDFSDDE